MDGPSTPFKPLHSSPSDMEIGLSEGRYQPAAGASASGRRPADDSPASVGLRSSASSDPEYSENARLVSSALSDDGMTPLIQPARPRKERLLLFCKRLLSFLLSHWYKALIVGIIITLIVLVSVKGFGFFGDLLTWFQRHNGWAGWGIFVGMYTAMVALFLPGVVLILGAGFVFGFWRGLLAVWAGGAVGQALAFLLARYLLHAWVESTLKKRWAKWAIIDKAIEHDGWKLVLILRFSPIIPYNLLNIAMATTNIPFWQFTLVSAVGIIYECAVFAYFGSMADNIHAIISGEGGPPPVFEWVMLGISAVMCVVGALFVSYSIKQAIKRARQHMSSAELDTMDGIISPTDDERQDHAELGAARLHPSYPASLEREGFVGSSTAYRLPASPEFELKSVPANSGATATAAAAAAREKARLLSGGGSGLLAVAASGSLQTPLGPALAGSGGSITRHASTKAKISPKASLEVLDPAMRRSFGADGSLDLGEAAAAAGGAAAVSAWDSAKPAAHRRHSSQNAESML